MTDTLDVENPAATGYQMQSWTCAAPCTCGVGRTADPEPHKSGCPYPSADRAWTPMESGAAARHWRPKNTGREAVEQAAMWTGAIHGVGIPAMQVVELATGRVVWRDSHRYPDAGDPIAPAWQHEAYAAARAEYAADHGLEAPNEPVTIQDTLF
ncbi:hypothetical protein HPO96_29300 [Kribbella sandramycini]|uniref:Uncharacterized protein n=1 Tax=Kribbella sandramycini TaxID=60450 RepID=A0A7Y4L6K4_9ACTN|nr:hypothetical protein [Kribbella sandramycini]MBB6571707.1 hypothetical protein [Kribbella sandramycini]NOL44352.1 hypothetical protein [Kribbella sandramycini]